MTTTQRHGIELEHVDKKTLCPFVEAFRDARGKSVPEAVAAFDRAMELNPNHPVLLHWYGLTTRFFLADPVQGLELYTRAVALDPLSPIILGNVSGALIDLGRFDEGYERARRQLEVAPDFAYGHFNMSLIYWAVFGNFVEAEKWMRSSLDLNPGSLEVQSLYGLLHLDMDDPETAATWIQRAEASGPDQFWANYGFARLHYYDGDYKAGRRYAYRSLEQRPPFWFDVSVPCFPELLEGDYTAYEERVSKSFPDLVNGTYTVLTIANFRHAINLAHVYAKTGRVAESEALLNKAMNHIQTRPRLGWAGYQVSDAEIYALQDRKNDALTALETAVDEGWRFNWRFWLEHSPNLETIRDEPRFKAVIAKLEADVAEQRSRIRLKAED